MRKRPGAQEPGGGGHRRSDADDTRSARRAARKAHMSDDDEAVWAHAARSLEPLRRSKPRVHPAIADGEPTVVFVPKKVAADRRKSTDGAEDSPSVNPADAGPQTGSRPALRPAPELQQFEHKRARRLRSGRLEIDARIDLHGMKQAEAHAALRRFLLACQADGRRMVLVITGKGGSPGRDGVSGDEAWGAGRERGVLKRNVPRWLAEADLRRIVVSYTTAAVRHGGEGAIYVQLRSSAP